MNFEQNGSCDQKMLLLKQILESLYNIISTLVAHLLHGIRLLEAAVVALKELQQQCQQRRLNDLEEQPEDLVLEGLEVQDYHINLKAFFNE